MPNKSVEGFNHLFKKLKMGRKLKRVPLNFQWEIGKLWCGFVNPHSHHECQVCKGCGYSEEFKELEAKWYSGNNPQWKPNPFKKNARYDSVAWYNNLDQEDVDALIEADRLWDFTRVPINDEQREIQKQEIANGRNSWLPFDNGYRPTAQEVNEWNLKGFGHDSINCSVVIKARLAKEGKPYLCPTCNGSGENWQSEKAKELFENWENYEPPTGDGFQLWSTTSEGNPMTPVFDTLEELCEYCENEGISVFGSNTATKEEWLEMLGDGFVYHREGNTIFL